MIRIANNGAKLRKKWLVGYIQNQNPEKYGAPDREDYWTRPQGIQEEMEENSTKVILGEIWKKNGVFFGTDLTKQDCVQRLYMNLRPN